jgi:membrane protein implicated in regulation of membrane protease activity
MPDQIVFWHWIVLGMVLAIFEMLLPGVVFLWLGVAAAATGVLLWLVPDLGWEYQIVVFAVLAIAATVAARLLWRRASDGATDHPTLNRRGQQYVGRTFTLDDPVVNGFGKLRVDDTTWKIAGDDLPAGARVRVTGVDGVVLRVERMTG